MKIDAIMAPLLTDMEQDALAELVNIAASGAAVRLRAMVGSEISLTVPAVALVPGSQAADTMAGLGLSSFMAVQQQFTGRLEGRAQLVFPAENYDELLRAVVGPEMSEAEFQDLASDALGEVGNVLLLGFLSTIGNMLRVDFDVSTPQVGAGQPDDLFRGVDNQVVLFIYMNFGVRGRSSTGYLALILGMESLPVLQQILAKFIEQVS